MWAGRRCILRYMASRVVRLKPVRDTKFPAHEFASLDAVVEKFLADSKDGSERKQIVAACFGCPGPVRDGRLKLTNLPWTLDARDLQSSLGIEHIFLINDLEANGYGIPELAAESIFSLHAGDAAAVGHRGLIAAGTGLGEALLIWDGKTHRPIASEGGHCDFAARTDREIALLEYLAAHVEWAGELGARGLGVGDQERVCVSARRGEDGRAAVAARPHGRGGPERGDRECAEDGSSALCCETMRRLRRRMARRRAILR